MGNIKEMQEKYFTEKGLSALKNKLASSVKYYNDPDGIRNIKKVRMLGFGKWEVDSKEELRHRIKELVHILGDIELTEETETVRFGIDINKRTILKIK